MSRTLLLDHSVPRGVRQFLVDYEVRHAFEMGWHELQNGDLLAAAELAGFAIMVTSDRNLRYQQNLSGRRIAIVELSTNHWPTLERHADRIRLAVEAVSAGSYHEVALERPKLRRRPFRSSENS